MTCRWSGDWSKRSRPARSRPRSRLDDDGRIARSIVPHDAADGRTDAAAVPASFATMLFREQFGEVTTPVLLFGAGHVGRAVVLALAPLPFSVRWIDSRADQFPQHVPQNVVTVCTDAVERELAEAPRDAMIVVMTHSHPLDFDITAQALQRGDVRFRRSDRLGHQTRTFRQLGTAARRSRTRDRPVGLPDRHYRDQRQGAGGDRRRARRATARRCASRPRWRRPARRPSRHNVPRNRGPAWNLNQHFAFA